MERGRAVSWRFGGGERRSDGQYGGSGAAVFHPALAAAGGDLAQILQAAEVLANQLTPPQQRLQRRLSTLCVDVQTRKD